jgi:EAL domain-containing protein (putative c-di-GMP-specific phosphodiesterase class I)
MVEGVETAEELSAVRGAHIEMVQGFHLCRPMDADGVRMQYLRPIAPLPDGGGLDRDHALQ